MQVPFASLICWWFGCVPDYAAVNECESIPCKRCGAFDVSYSDCVGDTRHAMRCDRLCFWRRLTWRRCKECGKRRGCDCVPF